MQELSGEVWRIVTAPYQVSLQRLHQLLDGVEQYKLLRWAQGRCDLGALAAAVVGSLQRSPLALKILQKLSCILLFRDAVLELEPALLSTLLNKATGSDQGYRQYATVCVALLADPLFASLPAEIPNLLTELVQRASQSPSIETMRPLHSLLRGIGCQSLEMLPPTLLKQAQSRLMKFPATLDKNAHTTYALCLAVLAKFASADSLSILRLDLPVSDIGNRKEAGDQFEPAGKFFGNKNIAKMKTVVLVRARWACSPSCTATVDDRIEILRLDKETIQFINSEARQHSQSRDASNEAKLEEYILQQELDGEVRHAALEFVAALHHPLPIPAELGQSVRLQLHDPDALCAPTVLENYLAQLNEPCVDMILLRALQSAVQYDFPSHGSLTNLKKTVQIIDAFGALSTTSTDVRQKILRSFLNDTLAVALQRFLDHTIPSSSSEEHTVHGQCPVQYMDLQLKCHRRLCSLILQTILYATDNKLSLEPSLAVALLEKQARLCAILPICSFFGRYGPTQKTKEISLFGAGSTPQDTPSHAWKDRLVEALSRDAKYQHQTVVQIVGEVCRDLEARCNDAEQPFRDEQAKSQDLQKRLKASEERNTDLEGQREESCQVINNFEARINRLQERADAAEQDSRSLQVELDNTQKKLELAEDEAMRAATASSEAARKQDLTYMETIMAKNRQYEEQVAKSELFEARVSELLKQCAIRQEREDQQQVQIAHAEESVARISHDLNVSQTLATERLATIEDLESMNAKLHSDIAVLDQKYQESAKQISSLFLKVESQSAAFEVEKANMQKSHAENVAMKEAEVEKLQKVHRNAITGLEKDQERAARVSERRMNSSRVRIEDLESKLTALRRAYTDQAQVMAEFHNKMTSRINNRPAGLDSPLSKSYIADDNDCAVSGLYDAEILPDDTSDEGNPMGSSGSSTSRKSGPSPKRPRIGTTYRCPSPSAVAKTPLQGSRAPGATEGYHAKGLRHPLRALGSASQNEIPAIPTRPMTQKPELPYINASAAIAQKNPNDTYEVALGDEPFSSSNILIGSSESD